MFANYRKINSDVERLVSMGAPEADIDAYISEKGGSVEGLRRYNTVKNKSLGEIFSNNFVSALKEVHSEGVSPITKGLDTAAFGLPRTILKAFNPELDKQLFPDQETLRGKVTNIAANVRGLLVGGAASLGGIVSKKAIPKVAGEGLKRQIARGAVTGGVISGTQFVGDPAETILEQIGKQGIQATFGSLLGGGIPAAGAIISKIKGGITAFSKGARGYVSDVLAPKMEIIIKNQVQKMNPNFVNFVENKLRIPKRALEIIARKGEAVLDEVYASTRGVVDDVADRLQRGLAARGQIADDAYGQVMAIVPEEQAFNANNTQNTIRRNLIGKKLINGAGEKLDRAKIATGPDKILLDVHDDILNTQNPTKADFSFWRDKLSSAYKETGSTNIDVKKAVDALYDDAVDSGYKGLQEARALYRAQAEMEKRFLKSSLIKQNKLNNYNKWSTAEKSELDDLISYIQDDFPIDAGLLDDLESTIASRELQVLKAKTSAEAIRGDLVSAKDPEKFNTIKNKWTEIVGDDAVQIFNEIKQSMGGETIRRVAEKAIIPVAASLGIGFAGYGAYRLGSEALHDLLGNIGSGGE